MIPGEIKTFGDPIEINHGRDVIDVTGSKYW
jgi:urease beta subunit